MIRVTMLGCGSSSGVPSLAVGWGDCDPAEPRNRRRRCSILVEKDGFVLLIDTSPDVREQLLDAGVSRLDAVLLTHAHADHTHGLDDLRPLFWRSGAPLDVYADRATMDTVRRRFGYLFAAEAESPSYFVPPLVAHQIELGALQLGPIALSNFRQDHGAGGHSLGLIFDGRIGYSTDVMRFEAADLARLAGLELWIVDCISPYEAKAHAHLDLALDWIAETRPTRAVLTHMNPHMDYRTTMAACPDGVEPGYDGLVVEVS